MGILKTDFSTIIFESLMKLIIREFRDRNVHKSFHFLGFQLCQLYIGRFWNEKMIVQTVFGYFITNIKFYKFYCSGLPCRPYTSFMHFVRVTTTPTTASIEKFQNMSFEHKLNFLKLRTNRYLIQCTHFSEPF